MKWYRAVAFVLTGCISVTTLKAQKCNFFSKSAYIESYQLEVTYDKTTNLVFPAAIISVDKGSQDILVQKATGVENILRVKADVKDFAETNLSVITSDGNLHSFIVVYVEKPAYLNINVSNISQINLTLQPVEKKEIIYTKPGANTAELAKYSDSVLNKGSNIHSIRNENSEVSIAMKGLYIKEDLLFCKLRFKNNSAINYDIDQYHFYVRDKKQSKRTASQEVEIFPVYISGDTSLIRCQSKPSWVVTLPKFTVPDGKYLAVEIIEKNGGRNLFMKVKNRHIMKARTI